jgi:hypothetical protein
VAAAIYPLLFPVFLIKPNVGIALFGFQKPSKWGIILSVLLLSVSLLIDPQWPVKWLSQLDGYTGYIPICLFGGPLLLLALLRWREPDGRLLILMAIMPKRSFYHQLLLWLIPKTRLQMLLLSAASWVSYYALRYFLKWDTALLICLVPLLFVLAPLYKSNYLKKIIMLVLANKVSQSEWGFLMRE